VTYSVYFLSQSDLEISAEDIVAACFLLFPDRFALRGYPQWPDSSVVNKRWVDCRKKAFITGSTAHGFSLTPKGLELAEKVGKTLEGKRPLSTSATSGRVRTETRTRAGRFIRAIEESDAYKSFKEAGELAIISEFDFRNMLLCTMESSSSTLRSNIGQFMQHSAVYKRRDIETFLEFCQRKFAHILADGTATSSQYEGGMLRRKVGKKGESK
jgi:hypothetical protein